MAKKSAQMDEEIIDLTELIEPGATGGRAAAAYAKTQAIPPTESEDFDAILKETAKPASSKNVDPNESLDMSDMGGIDNLLESLDIPAQPRENSKTTDRQPDPEELDSVLDDLLPPPSSKSAPAETTPEPDDFDLDALLNEESDKAEAPKKAPEPEKTTAMDADVDDILASFDEPAPAKQKTAPAPASAPVPEAEMAAELDDILGEIEAPPPPKPVTPPKPIENTVSDLSSFESDEPEIPEPSPESERKEVKLDAAKKTIIDPHADFMDDLDQELSAKEEETAEKPAQSEDPLMAHTPAHSHATLPAEVPAREASNGNHAVQTWPAEMIAGLCKGIATAQNSGDRETIQEFSRELGAQSAHVQDMGSQLTQLAKRILACESKVAAARARISSLEKGMEAASALEDLLRAGTPLHAGFMTLISTAVGNALQGFQPPNNDEAVKKLELQFLTRIEKAENRIAEMEKTIKEAPPIRDLENRMVSLESKLANAIEQFESLENKVNTFMDNFEATMEKSAATTVARLLQEEISNLMQE